MSNDLRKKVPAVACLGMVNPPRITDWFDIAPVSQSALRKTIRKVLEGGKQ